MTAGLEDHRYLNMEFARSRKKTSPESQFHTETAPAMNRLADLDVRDPTQPRSACYRCPWTLP